MQSLHFSFEVPQLGVGLERPWRQAFIQLAKPTIQARPVTSRDLVRGRTSDVPVLEALCDSCESASGTLAPSVETYTPLLNR